MKTLKQLLELDKEVLAQALAKAIVIIEKHRSAESKMMSDGGWHQPLYFASHQALSDIEEILK